MPENKYFEALRKHRLAVTHQYISDGYLEKALCGLEVVSVDSQFSDF